MDYIKRQRPQKLHLDLTLIQVLDNTRGGGSHVRSNEVMMPFLPQIPVTTTAADRSQLNNSGLMGDIALQRDEKMFQMRK